MECRGGRYNRAIMLVRTTPLILLQRAVLIVVPALTAASSFAEVVRVEVLERRSVADGFAFGSAGAYEKVAGRLQYRVDPAAPANARITDLAHARRDADGAVTFTADFYLLKPVDSARGNGRLLYDVNNRGDKLAVAAFNGARSNDPVTPADMGDGFLMRRGYAILWTGWNADVEPGDGRLTIDVPEAIGPEGPITGRIYTEICTTRPSASEPLVGGRTRVYPAIEKEGARLMMRARRADPGVLVPLDAWSLARMTPGGPVPDATSLLINGGFRPGWLYDLVYAARGPRVSGLGFAAVRDAISFFRYARGLPDNPLAGQITHAYAFGISQSARFLQHFLYEDFNADEQGRPVFDGVFAHVGAAGRTLLNTRFGQVTRHGSQHEDNLFPVDVFPFTTTPERDAVTGEEGDWLERCRAAGHLPKIVLTCTSTEYWNRGQSLLHTDVGGTRDVELDPHVRLYHIAGGHHLFSTPQGPGIRQYPVNGLNYRPVLRALLVAMDAWVSQDKPPPASRYPRIADGTLIAPEEYRRRFPAIPGVEVPVALYVPRRLDAGPRWNRFGIMDEAPPKAAEPYRVLVPAIDRDGNEVAGVRLPDVAVPVATYGGWNVRAAEYGARGALTRWEGSQFDFPQTPEDRAREQDPRSSVLERYPERASYLARLSGAADALCRARFLLEEDVTGMIGTAAARALWDEEDARGAPAAEPSAPVPAAR